MVLATGGLPPWGGVTDIEVNHLCPDDEEAKWRVSRAKKGTHYPIFCKRAPL
jgi:hypothetical protein